MYPKARLLLSWMTVLSVCGHGLARFLADLPPVTAVDGLAQLKRAASTSTLPAPPEVSEDPWQCITENITHYFLDVPRPTGKLESGIDSYGGELVKTCYDTATGADLYYCSVTDPRQWCGFTTAAPTTLLSSYSTYASAVTSFWKENSASISKLATSCPVSWAKPDPNKRIWLSIVSAHAQCFLNPSATATSTSPPTGGGTGSKTTTSPNTKPTTTTSKGVNLRGVETVMLMSTGLTVLAVA